jgi:murein DD-endopeptidase MepM/ murein hydrolase activator NlpD
MRFLAALAATTALGLSAAAVNAQTLPESAPVDPAAADPATEIEGEDTADTPDEGDAEERVEKDRGGKGRDGKDRGGKGGSNRRQLRLLRADAKPSKAWFKGRPATFRYAFDGRRRRNVVVQVKRKGRDPKIVRRFERKDVRPRKTHTIEWDGRVDGGRKYARQGTYKFKVRAKHGDAAEARNAAGKPEAGFYKHKFPVRAAHSYGDGLGAGRGHRGADVFARCGTKLQAARAGKVQFREFQGSGAGHYLVIDGKRDGKDYVYMHLQSASRHGAGEKVRTGETIGRVGESGNASGCHLHFELWSSPGWYEGGDFLDPMPKLHSWDRFS